MRQPHRNMRHPFHELAAKPRGRPFLSPLGVTFLALTFLLLLLGALTFTWLQSASQKRARQAQKLRDDMVQGTKQYENLRVDYETFTGGDYIRAAVDRFALSLHEPYYGQVCCIRKDGSTDRRPNMMTQKAREESALVARNW